MAFVRLVKDLMRDKETGRRWVPIVPGRGPHLRHGVALPVGRASTRPRARPTSRSTATSCCTTGRPRTARSSTRASPRPVRWPTSPPRRRSYATHGEPMIPFYIFYSMFGFQRTGDQFWALADQLGRGFVIGATAGRTTMTGEGLQHADGHSPLLASTNPAALTYDPAFAYEIAAIVKEGLRRMYGEAASGAGRGRLLLPDGLQRAEAAAGDAEGRRRGGHPQGPLPLPRPAAGLAAGRPRASSCWPPAPAIHWALEAQKLLAEEWGVAADVWSATSWTRAAPRRDGVRRGAAARRGAGAVRAAALAGAPGPGAGRQRLDAAGARTRSPVGRAGLRLARHRRLRALRHPGGRPPPLRCRRGVRRRGGARPARPPRRGAGHGGQGGPRALRPSPPSPPGPARGRSSGPRCRLSRAHPSFRTGGRRV